MHRHLRPVYEHYRRLQGLDLNERLRNGESWSDIGRESPLYHVDDLQEFARALHGRGMSIRRIAVLCKLKFGKGCKSHVHRIVNEKAYRRHLQLKSLRAYVHSTD